MQRLRTGTALLVLAAVLISPFAASAQGLYGDDSIIPAGCHPITAEERAGILAMNAQIPTNGMFCDKDKALLYGGCETSPYPYLQTKDKTGRPDTVSGLNSDFACRLYKFFKAADAAGQNISIASGYRSVELQKQLYDKYIACGKCGAPVAPPGSSKHNYGLAVDLSFNGQRGPTNTAQCMSGIPSCQWAHVNNAQFGLMYPMEYEPWHIEPSGTVSGKQQPLPQTGWTGDVSSMPYTNTGSAFSPSSWTPSMMSTASQFSPLLGAFNQQQAPAQPTYPSYPSYPTYPQPEVLQIPTPTSTVFEVPPPYVYPISSSTQGTSTKELSAYEQIQLYTKEYEWKPTSESTSSSAPTGGTASTTDVDTDAETGGSNVYGSVYENEKPIASTSVDVNPIHVTETFSQNASTKTGAASTSTATSAAKALLISLMTKLRDVLMVFVQILTSRPGYGFEAPWKR